MNVPSLIPSPVREAARRLPLTRFVLLTATATATAAVLVPAPQPLQALGGVALTAVLPGAAITPLLLPAEESRPSDRLLRALVTVTLSLATTVAAGLALLYLQRWSWQGAVVVLASVTAVASLADVLVGRWPWRPSA
jgi:hypothetical protein